MIRVLIADDHPLIREGVRRVLTSAAGMRIVGEAGDGSELLELLPELEADVLLLDISMPGPPFFELLSRLRQEWPALRIVILSMFPESQYGERALAGGAHGYVCKRQAVEELPRAIRRVHSGGTHVMNAVPHRMTGGAPAAPSPVALLSAREFEVMLLLARGLGITSIGERLTLSPKTVSTYRHRVLQKLGLTSNAELVRLALEQQLIV
ncbi:MAG: response regulator transcription factor [Gemmatimonadales bacterium]